MQKYSDGGMSHYQWHGLTADYEKFRGGFPLASIVESGDVEKLLCFFCNKIARDLFHFHDCGHSFCTYCFELNIDDELRKDVWYPCPRCKKLNFYFFHNSQRALENSTLRKVEYPIKINCTLGCGFIGHPTDVTEHEDENCLNRQLKCRNEGCEFITEAKHIIKHFKECPLTVVECETCKMPIYRKYVQHHDCIKNLKYEIQRAFNRLESNDEKDSGYILSYQSPLWKDSKKFAAQDGRFLTTRKEAHELRKISSVCPKCEAYVKNGSFESHNCIKALRTVFAGMYIALFL